MAGVSKRFMNTLKRKPKPGTFLSKYRMNVSDKLGEGKFAEVFKCYSLVDDSEYAVKVITNKAMSEADKKGINLEIQVLEDINHPNIVRLHETFRDKKKTYLVLELIRGGELFDRITKRNHYSEQDAAATVKIIAQALKYIHDKNIVHRDLKPENLLLVSKTDDKSVKLADFGFSAYCHEELDDGVGSLMYCAPEIIRGKPYKTGPDMWSLGIITYILLCGYPPFYDANPEVLSKKIVRDTYKFRKEDWKNISEDAKNLIRGLIKRDPSLRFTADQVLEHPWIQNIPTVSNVNLEGAVTQLREFVAKEKLRAAVGAAMAVAKLQNILDDLPDTSGKDVPEEAAQHDI